MDYPSDPCVPWCWRVPAPSSKPDGPHGACSSTRGLVIGYNSVSRLEHVSFVDTLVGPLMKAAPLCWFHASLGYCKSAGRAWARGGQWSRSRSIVWSA
jgi:hypothetical protein